MIFVKQRMALRRYQGVDGWQDAALAIFAGDEEALAEWSQPLTTEEKADRKNLMFDMWLAGGTTGEIAEKLLLAQQSAWRSIQKTAEKRLKEAVMEEPPTYNVWNFNSCDPRFGQKHPGQIPGQAVMNLLLWLTDPFDLVVDPMGGGGTVIDVCKHMLRRYQVFDINPIFPRPDISKWDIRDGFPKLGKKPHLIFLDPPYWRLKRDQYSAEGAAAGSYGEWLGFMDKLAKDSAKTVRRGGYVALMVESFFDEKVTGRFLHCGHDCLNLFEAAGLTEIQEISVNMPSQIKSFRDVQYAKKRNILLDIKRDLLVFQRAVHAG